MKTTASEPISHGKFLAIVTVQALAFIVLGLALWRWTGRSEADFVRFDLGAVVLGLSLCAGLLACLLAMYRFLPRFADRLVWLQKDTYKVFAKPFGPLGIVWISICAGIGEEALIRGGLQTALLDHLGVVPAIVLSALVFTLLHLAKPLVAAILFGIGLAFGIAYHLSGSLLAMMIAHVGYDIVAVALLQKRMQQLRVFEPESETTPARALQDG